MYTYFSLIGDVITYFPDKPIKIIDELDDSGVYSELEFDEIQDCYYAIKRSGLYKYKNREKKYEYVFVNNSGFIYLFADYQKYNLLNFVMYNNTKLKIQFNDNIVDYSDVNIFMNIRKQIKKIIVSYIDINSFINVPINLPLFSTIDNDKVNGKSYVIHELEIVVMNKCNFGIVRDLLHIKKIKFIKDIYNDNITYLFKYEEPLIKIAISEI